MISKSFDNRLDQIQWQPSAVPTREVVDSILGTRSPEQMRSVGLSLAGAILGILIGVGLVGMMDVNTPWGPGSGLAGVLVGLLSLISLSLSVVLAVWGAVWHQRKPGLLQFSSMNLLMIVVILLS